MSVTQHTWRPPARPKTPSAPWSVLRQGEGPRLGLALTSPGHQVSQRGDALPTGEGGSGLHWLQVRFSRAYTPAQILPKPLFAVPSYWTPPQQSVGRFKVFPV